MTNTIDNEVEIYDPSTYRSTEQKIGEKLKPFGNFGKGLIEGFYGAVASAFRYPTFIRKTSNRQSIDDRKDDSKAEYWGIGIGTTSGILTDIAGLYYMIDQLSEGNYIPAGVLALTNIASGIYELGRKNTTKREHEGVVKLERQRKQKRTDINTDFRGIYDLDSRVIVSLEKHNIWYPRNLICKTRKQVAELDGIGKKTMKIIDEQILKPFDLKYKDE